MVEGKGQKAKDKIFGLLTLFFKNFNSVQLWLCKFWIFFINI